MAACPAPRRAQDVASWYHLACIFNAQKRSRTWKIDSADLLTGFASLSADDQATVKAAIATALADKTPAVKGGKALTQAKLTAGPGGVGVAAPAPAAAPARKAAPTGPPPIAAPPSSFAFFQRTCERIGAEPSSNAKSALVSAAFGAAKADLPTATLLVKLLIPGKDARVYNVQDKSIARVLAGVFGEDPEEMAQAIAVSGCVCRACLRGGREFVSVCV